MSNMQARQATIHRKTSETDIELFLCLDGEGNAQVDTGIGFFDHMLKSFAKHGMFDLNLKVTGPIQIVIILVLVNPWLVINALSPRVSCKNIVPMR